MKKVQLTALFSTVILLSFSAVSFAQGVASCKVTSMPGFPTLPNDSAYEGQSYTYHISLANTTVFPINTPLDIQLKVDSVETTIFADPQPSIAANDTIDITIASYNFSQAQFKAGNNIVVVWPRIQNAPALPIDTFYTMVYFIPLNSLSDGMLDINELYFNSFPVPAIDYINFETVPNKHFDYVRIISVTGQIVLYGNPLEESRVFIGNLPAGNYFVETGLNGKRYRSKFIKQ